MESLGKVFQSGIFKMYQKFRDFRVNFFEQVNDENTVHNKCENYHRYICLEKKKSIMPGYFGGKQYLYCHSLMWQAYLK